MITRVQYDDTAGLTYDNTCAIVQQVNNMTTRLQ